MLGTGALCQSLLIFHFFFFYSADQYDNAERWCGLSMRLLKHLTSLQASYEEKVCFEACSNLLSGLHF